MRNGLLSLESLRLTLLLGSVGVSTQPQQNRSQGQHFLEIAGFFLKARSNSAKVFALAEHALDHMTLLAQEPIALLPAAQACARITVLSMQTFCKSALRVTLSKILSHTPNRLQLEKRLNTLFQRPRRAGRQRHCAPQRKIHRTASTNWRHAASQAMRTPTIPLNLARTWSHSLSLSLLLSMAYRSGKILLTHYVNRA